MHVVVGGGGSAEAEANVLAAFARGMRQNPRVLYLPWAQTDPSSPALEAWARSTLGAHGIEHVECSKRVVPTTLDGFDGVFLGGGNTYLLSSRLRSTAMGDRLSRALRDGLVGYGGSAGAIVLGAHIGTCAHLDRNEVGATDFSGLDLFAGRVIWCHAQPGDRAAIRRFAADTRREVLVLSEDAGFAFDGVRLTSIGPGRAEVWTAEGIAASR